MQVSYFRYLGSDIRFKGESEIKNRIKKNINIFGGIHGNVRNTRRTKREIRTIRRLLFPSDICQRNVGNFEEYQNKLQSAEIKL